MKSIGETLKEAREAKGSSIQQIALDINISREYLTALEEERFDIFPAETYLLGFLRNYAEALGLDTEKTIGLYKNYKISEEPVPLEELVGQKKSSAVSGRLVLIILLLGGLAVGGWFLYQSLMEERPVVLAAEEVYEPVRHRLNESSAEWTLRSGDEILIPREGEEMILGVLVESDRLVIRPAGGTGDSDLFLAPGEETTLAGGEGEHAAAVQLNTLNGEEAVLTVRRIEAVAGHTSVSDEAEVAPPSVDVVEDAEKVLLENIESPDDFTLNAVFSGYCLFRYQADDGDNIEKYYHNGDRIRLDVDRKLMVWLSSSGTVSMRIAGVNVTPGKVGEVAVKLIQWVKNDEGKYNLVLFPVQ